jgi:hypothetical protein
VNALWRAKEEETGSVAVASDRRATTARCFNGEDMLNLVLWRSSQKELPGGSVVGVFSTGRAERRMCPCGRKRGCFGRCRTEESRAVLCGCLSGVEKHRFAGFADVSKNNKRKSPVQGKKSVSQQRRPLLQQLSLSFSHLALCPACCCVFFSFEAECSARAVQIWQSRENLKRELESNFQSGPKYFKRVIFDYNIFSIDIRGLSRCHGSRNRRARRVSRLEPFCTSWAIKLNST